MSLRILVVAAAGLASTLFAGAAPASLPSPGNGCTRGTLLFADGPLRIVAIGFGGSDGTGNYEFACLGARGRPKEVGGTFAGTGVATAFTPLYAFDGARYLATLQLTDGEGGPDAYYEVYDMRTRRRVRFANTVYDDERPPTPIRVTAAGDLLMPGLSGNLGTVELLVGSKPTTLSTPGADARSIALTGKTAYWTEQVGAAPAVARSAPVRGSANPHENHLLEPISIPRARSRCAMRKGSTIAASPHVRVLRSGAKLYVCRAAGRRLTPLGPHAGPVDVVADRWLLSRTGSGEDERLTVFDTKSARTVTDVIVVRDAQATLLSDGTLAWLPDPGPLMLQKPGATMPTVLAAAAEAPGALASTAKTIYWTAGGAPHRYSTAGSP